MADLIELTTRLARLEDLQAIRDLKFRYCRACDRDYDGPAIAACYTEDGAFNAFERGGGNGRAEIAAYFDGVEKEITAAAHIAVNEEISVDGDEGTGHWWLLMPSVRNVDGENSAHWYIAEYSDTYRRVEGEWLISSQTVHTHRFGPASEDWSQSWLASKALARI